MEKNAIGSLKVLKSSLFSMEKMHYSFLEGFRKGCPFACGSMWASFLTSVASGKRATTWN
jgi:hypothetical protein